jgi:hypothetical protein
MFKVDVLKGKHPGIDAFDKPRLTMLYQCSDVSLTPSEDEEIRTDFNNAIHTINI